MIIKKKNKLRKNKMKKLILMLAICLIASLNSLNAITIKSDVGSKLKVVIVFSNKMKFECYLTEGKSTEDFNQGRLFGESIVKFQVCSPVAYRDSAIYYGNKVEILGDWDIDSNFEITVKDGQIAIKVNPA